MESACHCSVQAGQWLWLLVQGWMYSLLIAMWHHLSRLVLFTWLWTGHSSLELKVTARFMQLHLVLRQVSPEQHAAVRLPCDAFVLFPREKFFFSPFWVTSHLECVFKETLLSPLTEFGFLLWYLYSGTFFGLELPWMALLQISFSCEQLKVLSGSEAFNPQDWLDLVWNSQMPVLWVLGPGCCCVSLSRSLGSAELP